MKNIILLLLSIYVFSCSTTDKCIPVPAKKVVETIVANNNLVKVLSLKNFTDKEKEKSKKYISKMNEVIASNCFGSFMVERKLGETNSKTNKQVVQDLRTKTATVHLEMYYKRFSKVHGYTKPNVNRIWLNRKYHAGASICSEASNLAHELSHKLGYGHSYNATQSRPYTVPYSINAAFTACCN